MIDSPAAWLRAHWKAKSDSARLTLAKTRLGLLMLAVLILRGLWWMIYTPSVALGEFLLFLFGSEQE